MRKITIALGAATMLSLGACGQYGTQPGYYGATGANSGYREARAPYGTAGQTGGYDPAREYQRGNYRPRRLASNDEIYRGSDGRYYCKRDNGTTGLVVGGVAGGVLGNLIAPGGSKTLGTILGAAGGAIAGRAVDKNGNSKVECR